MSDDNVTKFPEPLARPDLLIGPFEYYKVRVEGRAIPHLTGYPRGDDEICLIVDDRFAIDVPKNLAHQVAWLVANAMAVAQGYSHLGAESRGLEALRSQD